MNTNDHLDTRELISHAKSMCVCLNCREIAPNGNVCKESKRVIDALNDGYDCSSFKFSERAIEMD